MSHFCSLTIFTFYRAFHNMLDMGRWKYDAKRCLSIYCRTPAVGDDKLREYVVTPEVALQALEPYSLVQDKKRKRAARSLHEAENPAAGSKRSKKINTPTTPKVPNASRGKKPPLHPSSEKKRGIFKLLFTLFVR
jgi:hypothetical protein